MLLSAVINSWRSVAETFSRTTTFPEFEATAEDPPTISQMDSIQTSSIFEEKEVLQVLGLILNSSQIYRRSRLLACVGSDDSCYKGSRVCAGSAGVLACSVTEEFVLAQAG